MLRIPEHSSAVACVAHQCMRLGEPRRLTKSNKVPQLSTYVSDRAKLGNYLPALGDTEPSADVLRPDLLTRNDVHFKSIEKFLLLLATTSFEYFRIKLANDQESSPTGQQAWILYKFRGSRPSRQERGDIALSQRRRAIEENLEIRNCSVARHRDIVVTNGRAPDDVQLWIQWVLASIKINVTVVDIHVAERERSRQVLNLGITGYQRFLAGTADLDINNHRTTSEIALYLERIFRYHRNIELPIIEWRRVDGDIRRHLRWLRRGLTW